MNIPVLQKMNDEEIRPHLRGLECFEEFMIRLAKDELEFDGYVDRHYHLGRFGPLRINGGLVPIELKVNVSEINSKDIPKAFYGISNYYDLEFIGRLKNLKYGYTLLKFKRIATFTIQEYFRR